MQSKTERRLALATIATVILMTWTLFGIAIVYAQQGQERLARANCESLNRVRHSLWQLTEVAADDGLVSEESRFYERAQRLRIPRPCE